MTITDFIASLRVGDTITYQMKTGQTTKQKIVTRTGIIKQIRPKFITVQLDKYPDSVEINEIANGRIQILDAEGNPIPIEPELLKASEPPTLPIEYSPRKKSQLEIEPEPPKCARTKQGTVDWEVMWPIVETKLARGQGKYEIADEFGIGHKAMASKVRKVKAKLKQSADIPSPVPDDPIYSELRGKSRAELLALYACRMQQGVVIDMIVSCIDATLAGEEKEEQAI